MPAEHAPTLYVVSDSRGQTSAAVLQAALVQFQGQRYTIVREANVRTVEHVRLCAVPYAVWGNREVGEMDVWLPEEFEIDR